jgi:multidrug efflux pump subunit AcrA (membrane-fusion protein)
MKKIFGLSFILISVMAISIFIVQTFMKSSPAPIVAQPPVLDESPVRVYGVTEPAGREVFVSPTETKEVIKIFVQEGDVVREGQTLCVLDNEVELAQLQSALARVDAAKKTIAIIRDEMKRTKNLYKKNVDSEYKYSQALLKYELEKSNLVVAQKEVELDRAHLKQLELTSPINGKVYKFDVRLGETLSSGDNTRIILGSADLWVRLFVEAYWKDTIDLDSRFKVYNSETDAYLGMGTVIYKAPYMGRRNFRTEDSQERFDTKFQEIVLLLSSEGAAIPIALSVVAELQKEKNKK